MRKTLALLLALAMLLSLAACAAPAGKGEKLRVVTTIFPLYDWTRHLLGSRADEVELVLLLDDGVDMHSFQPSVADMVTVSSCDLLICVGGEADAWIADALAERKNEDMAALMLLDTLGADALNEELREGMEGEAEDEPDEHIWLSPKKAIRLCAAIRDALCALDSEHRAAYEAACGEYTARLAALDAAYRETVASARLHTLVFADRFPFRYLTEDYGLDYYAAFAGCSAETEASFATVIFLAGKADELGVTKLCVIETSDGKLARTVGENMKTGAPGTVTLHSMQGKTGGMDYIALMEQNLAALKEALN